MARFLFIIADSWGPLGCTVPVAKELERRGHTVAFSVFDFHGFINRSNPIIPALDAKAILAGEGFEIIDTSIPPFYVPGTIPTPKNFLFEYGAFQSLFRDYLVPYYEYWTRVMVPRFEEFAPDAIWVKDQVVSGALAAEVMGLPWATFSVHTGLLEDRDSLPWTFGVSRPRNALERVRNKVLKWGMRAARRTLDAPFNAARRHLGLPPVKDAMNSIPVSPHLYTLFVPEEIEPRRRSWPSQVRFVGPYSWDEPSSYERPAWLEELPDDVPFVYATIGTLSNRMEIDFYLMLIDALKDEPVIVGLSAGSWGDDWVTSRLPEPPPNFRVEGFLPNSAVVPRASVLVHHAGAGTAMQGYQHGVPCVAVPLNHEHHDIAQRIVEQGVGVRLDRSKLKSPEQLRDAVRTVLGDPSYRAAAKDLQRRLAHYDAAVSCADALLELAGASSASAGGAEAQRAAAGEAS